MKIFTRKLTMAISIAISLSGITHAAGSQDRYTRAGVENSLYVKAGATGEGSSWNDAMGSIEAAVSAAAERKPCRIYVANGIYTFSAKQTVNGGISIEGGYAGEGSATVVTMQSGKAGDIFILQGSEEDGIASLSHLTISGASKGRGVRGIGYARISNCIIENNTCNGPAANSTQSTAVKKLNYSGAGIYAGDNVTVENCIIRGNTAKFVGGGLSIGGDNVIIKNCLISGNKSLGTFSSASCSVGGILCWAPTGVTAESIGDLKGAKLINLTIANNEGLQVGGTWIGGSFSKCEWINTVFWGNKETTDNSISEISYPAKPGVKQVFQTFYNLYSTKAVTSLENNNENRKIVVISEDNNPEESADAKGPCFSDPGNGVYTLQQDSPLINVGDNEKYGEGLDSDKSLSGTKRLLYDIIDIGAYEWDDTQSGLDNMAVEADADYPKEYYNLRGIKLNGKPEHEGVYIERIGTSVRKIIIK